MPIMGTWLKYDLAGDTMQGDLKTAGKNRITRTDRNCLKTMTNLDLLSRRTKLPGWEVISKRALS